MAKNPQTEIVKNTVPVRNTMDWGKIYQDLESYALVNQKKLTIIIGSILGVILLFLAYIFLYQKPKEVDAKNQIFKAEQYYAEDSLDKALKGDGNNIGFESVESKFSGTEPGNLAHYYLGSIYLRKGEFQKAIDQLSDYNAKDDLTGSLSLGMIGDAYSELNNFDKSLEYYHKAESFKPNNFTSPMFLMKEGLVLEKLNKNSEALEVYNRIKKDFNESSQAREIDKYIARVNQKI